MSACNPHRQQPLTDAADGADRADGPGDLPKHSRSRRLVALLVALFLLAITVLAAGFSLFHAPPTPDRTRPLPHVIPKPGAVR